MSLGEYAARKSGALLKQVHRMGELADFAFMLRAAEAVDANGRYLVQEVSQLYNTEKAKSLIFGESPKEEAKWQELERIARAQQEWEAEHGRL